MGRRDAGPGGAGAAEAPAEQLAPGQAISHAAAAPALPLSSGGGGVCNIAARLRRLAEQMPTKRAVVFPAGRDSDGRVAYTHLTFEQFDRESDAIARGFRSIGLDRGVKTLLMVTPSLEFFALTFALFKVGAVPVLIDPGMGLSRLLHCIQSVQPTALVGIPKAHVARLLFPSSFRSVQLKVTVGRRLFWGGHTLRDLRRPAPEPLELAPTRAEDLAAILFTTGSTGPAKGVEYEHGMFDAQCDLLADAFGMGPDDIDLPTFPLFALFSVTLGMTAVVPDMDPTRPAHVDPAKIAEAVSNQGCTFTFGSPALWKRVSGWCIENHVTLPSLRQILLAGAPVPPGLHERLRQIAPNAETNTPYGATESLPVSSITGSEVLEETGRMTRQGRGICVGRPIPVNTVRIIRITEEALPEWSDDLLLPTGQIGEITVKGPTVTKRYYQNESATAAHKMQDGGDIVHRIGDLGYLDEQGRLWMCGRKSHRVETDAGLMPSVCCEAFFNEHPAVNRSALVGLGERPRQTPVIIIELAPGQAPSTKLTQDLLAVAQQQSLTAPINHVLYHPSFPVDIRHNAKINREALTEWARERLRPTVTA